MTKFPQQRFLDWFMKYDLTRLPEFFASFRSRWWRMICWFGRSRITVWLISAAAWFIRPTFKWWTFYSENSDSCVRCCGEKRKKSYTTATSYRRATWPRFRRNKLICAYIYIPQWWSSCIGFVRAWIAANCTTDQCNRSQPCENGNFTRIYRLFDWPTYTSHLTSRNTVVHIHTHTHTVPRKMHAMREIFLRYLKIVRVLQGRSLGIRFTGFLFEVFRLKKKSESSAQSMGIFSFIDREKRIWVR